MASDVSSGCTEVNELFDDEKEEGEISLEDVSSSEEGQLYKYPPRTYRGQCPQCLSTQHCATWCRSLTVNKVNNVKRDGGVQGKENRGNRHYDKEPAGVSNIHGKHTGLYSTLQEKNDDEGQNDLVPISSDSDMELVGLEPTKKEKKHRKLHKKRRKKSPLPPDLTLALSIKESIHRLESGLFKKDAGSKSSHSRVRYSPDKKSVLPLPSQQRRHSRLSPVMMRPRRPRSPLLRKPSPPLRQRKLPPQAIPVSINEEVDLPLEPPSSRGSVNKLLKKVRNLEPFSSRSKEKGSSLKDKLSNIIKSDKKDTSTEEAICKENKPTETVAVKRDSSKNEIKSKESNKKKEKDIEKTKEKDRVKDKSKEKEKSKEHEKEKAKEKVKEKEHDKDKAKERVKQKEREKNKAKDKVKGREKVKEKIRENVKEKEKKKIKEKEMDEIKEKDKINEKIKIKEEKEEEKKSLEEHIEDDDDLIVLRQIALETKQKRNTLLRPEEIKIEPIDHEEEEEMQGNKYPKMPNFCMDDNDEDLQLRMIALRSAVIKKHRTRMQFGLKKKQTKNHQQKDQQESMVPRMESPFTASFIDDFPLLAEMCSPSSPLSKKDSLSVEDMVLDSDMELTAISEDESPYSPSDDIVCEIADSSLYTPSKPTETPCLSRSNVKPPIERTNNMDGSFLEFVNQESRPYSPTDVTIYDPDLPGVHSNTDPSSVLTLTPPQMQHTQPLHSTPPSQPAPPLQPPPLPPLSMFTTPVAIPEPMVLGCPPNMLNPFVDPTLANFPVNPMMLPPPQLFTPFTSMPPPAPSLPAPASQLEDFGETDLDGSPLVPIEKDAQQQQQQWRLLNEPLYLQDLPPLGETQMNNMPMLTTPNLVPTAVLKSNKQLQKQPLRKSPARDNSLFRNAQMTPVVLEPDVCKAGAMFKPMKLQSSAKKIVPLQPAAAFNSTAEDADSSSTSQFNADSSMEKTRDQRKSVTPSPSEHKRKRSKRERRAAKRANLRERMRTVKTISTTNNATEESKRSSDKKRRSSVDDDEQILREILLASMAKRIKEQPDKALSTAEPSSCGASTIIAANGTNASTTVNAVDVEKPKTDASSVDATKQTAISKSNTTDARTSKQSDTNLTPVSILTISSGVTTISTSSVATTTTPTSSTEATSTSAASTTIQATNNLKRSASALADSQPLSKIARKTASAKVVNNAKRYQNLLLQRKLAQQKNSTATSTVSRFKVTNNGSLPQRSISPNVAKLESNRLVINLNEDTESESEKEEAKLSPTKERPQLSIPETEFEKNLNQFLKCAREQHEMAAASATTGTVAETTANPPEPETAVSSSTSEITASSMAAESASPSATETANPSAAETSSPSATEATAITSTTTLTSSTTSTFTVSTSSKTSDTVISTTSPTVPSTSKAVETAAAAETTASTSKAAYTSVKTIKISTDITPLKITTTTTTPIAKTSITTITKTNASTSPVKVTADQVATAVKVATTAVTKNDSTPKISAKILSNPALTPLAVQHLPPPQLEEYRRLKQRIYEYERLKRQKAKELGVSVPATNPALKKPVNNVPTPSPSVKSPPSLTTLALASSTPKPTSKPSVVADCESSVSATSTLSVAAVSTPSITVVSKPTITAVSVSSITTVSTVPDVAASKLPVTTSTVTSASAASVKTSASVRTPSASITTTKSIVVNSTKSATNVSSSIGEPLPTVSKMAPKPQLVATISPIAKSSRAEPSPIVLMTPTKIVHSTAISASLVKSVPNKTASISNVATSRNTIANNSTAATSSTRIIPQSTQESPTKLLDKMNAALNNQRLQMSAVAHKVSSLKILTREQINHKSSQKQETTPSTSTVNLNLNRINKEATSRNNNVSKLVVENLPVGRSNNLNKTPTEVRDKEPRAPGTSASADNTKNNWEDFKHEVNNEVQSLADLATEDQRNLLRDTEEKLINKRHLVLDDITEMSSNLRQWEIERDLQNMLSAEVKKLREQLRIAEEKMQQQKEKLNSIQPKVSSYHEKINAGRKECFRLSKICSGLGQQVVGPSYKVPTAGAELLNNRIKEVANHTQKLKSKKAQSSGTLKNNDSQKTDKTKLKDNPKLNTNNLRSNEINSRQNNFNTTGASLPNNHNVNTNSNAKNIGIVKSGESAAVSKYDNRIIKEEIVTDESSDEDVSVDSFNNDSTAQSEERNVNNSFLNTENIRTDKSLNNDSDSNASLTTERLISNSSNSRISNNQSKNYFNSENKNSHNPNKESVLNVNQNMNAFNEKTNAESSLENKISSRENNESIGVEQTNAFTSESNVESENLNYVSDNNVEIPQNEIINQNLLITTDTDNNIYNADNLNVENEKNSGNIIHTENSVNESSFEQNALIDGIADGASINGESDKNIESETTPVVDNVERTQQNELCPESNGGNVNTIIQKIKSEPEMEMEVDSGVDSVLQSTIPQAENVEYNNNTEDVEEFADSKLNENVKETNEENYQSKFPATSAGTEHSTLLEEINLLEIANAVEVPKTFTRYSQMFKRKKRPYRSVMKAENVKEDSKKKKVPRPYESILKHLNAPRNYKTDGILCPYELMGTCYDGDCQYVHQSTSHS